MSRACVCIISPNVPFPREKEKIKKPTHTAISSSPRVKVGPSRAALVAPPPQQPPSSLIPRNTPRMGSSETESLLTIFLHVVILTHMEINASNDLGNSLGDNSHFRSSLRLLRKVHSLPTPCPLPISKSQLRNQPCFSYLAKGWTFCVQLHPGSSLCQTTEFGKKVIIG